MVEEGQALATSMGGFKQGLDNLMEVRTVNSHYPQWFNGTSIYRGLLFLNPSCSTNQQWGRAVAFITCLIGFPEASSWPLCDSTFLTTWTFLDPVQQNCSYVKQLCRTRQVGPLSDHQLYFILKVVLKSPILHPFLKHSKLRIRGGPTRRGSFTLMLRHREPHLMLLLTILQTV